MILEYLSWDSSFFNKKIGRIQLIDAEQQQLISLLAKAREENYQLVYVFSPEQLLISNELLSKMNGMLVDRKIVYRQSFEQCSTNHEEVEEYTSNELAAELLELAYASGVYSRFYLDSGFSTDDFKRLYQTWITKSLSKELADRIFVIKKNGIIEAMITLKMQDKTAEIGLLAVSENARGNKYGTKLIDTCKCTLANKGIHILDVPTQLHNNAACSFYENCGFEKLSVTNIYHFWL